MLKTLFYFGFAIIGIVIALFSPLYGAIAVLESYLLHPTLFSPELESIRIQLLVTGAFIAGLAIHRPRGFSPVAAEGRLLWSLGLYAVLVLASSQWAIRRPDVALPFAIDLCRTALVALLLVQVTRDSRGVSLLLWAMLVGASHAAFMHTVGVNIGYLAPSLGTGEMGALPDFQGSIMVFVLPTMLLMALFSKGWKAKVFCWVSLPLVADSIINTYQRTFFVAVAAQLAYLLVTVPRRAMLKLGAVIAVGASCAILMFMPADYLAWINTVQTFDKEASASSRLTIAKASISMLTDYPLGVGYRNYQYVSPDYLVADVLTRNEAGEQVRAAHSTFFSVACETGIPGILLFAGTFGGTWWLLRKTRKMSKSMDELALFAFGLEAGLIGWAVAGLFQSLHEDDPVFWTVAFSIMLYRSRHMVLSELFRHSSPSEPSFGVAGTAA